MISLFDPETDGYGSGHPTTVLIGPPGTGKTTAILNAWLLPALQQLDPLAVLGCSFSVAAATVMRERLANHFPDLDEWTLKRVCSTIHSEAYRLVKLHGSVGVWDGSKAKPGRTVRQKIRPEDSPVDIEYGIEDLARPRSELREETERLWGMARNKWPRDIPRVDSSRLVSFLARAVSFAESRFQPDELAAEVVALEADKAAAGCVDFADMLTRALDCDPPERVLLLVDEAQDLSPLQIQLVEHWAGSSEALAWVGDPDQGIYAFSGADGGYLTDLARGGHDVQVRSLQQSYRVPALVHASARNIILRNRDRVDAPYLPTDDSGEVLDIDSCDVEQFLDHRSIFGDVFVLARSRAILSHYAKALTEAGVPFANERGGSPMRQGKVVSTVLALWDILSRRLVSKEHLAAFIDAIPGRPRSSFLLGKKKDAQRAVKALEEGQHLRPDQLADVGLDGAEIRSCACLTDALERIKKLETYAPQLRIIERKGIDALRKKPAITLTTMHASKGREAPTVLVDLEAPWPVRIAVARGDHDAEESERRLLYVAVTRSLHTLAIVSDDAAVGLDGILGVRL